MLSRFRRAAAQRASIGHHDHARATAELIVSGATSRTKKADDIASSFSGVTVPNLDCLPVKADRTGRIVVESDLSLFGHPEVRRCSGRCLDNATVAHEEK
jgi:hypothetical protein